MMKSILKWAASWRVWLAIWALAVMAVPVVALIAAITIIGIPIAILLALIPGVAFTLLPAAFIKDALARQINPATAWIVALGTVLAASALTASAINAGLENEAEALRAGDFDTIVAARSRSIALVGDNAYRQRDEFACASACLRLLLAGAADEVLVANGKDLGALDDAVAAVAARFEKGGACIPLRVSDADLSIDGEPSRAGEFARRRIAAGDCLVEREARLGEADAIITFGAVDNGESVFGAGLDLLADTVRATRLSYLRRVDGALREEYRSTGVIAHKHPPILFPTIVTGYAFEAKVGFLRFDERSGFVSRYNEEPDLAGFLENKLHLKIRLDPAVAPDQDDLIDTLIARSREPLTVTELAVVDDFYRSFITAAKPWSREDAERATMLLERPDYELTFSGPGVARTIASAYPDLAGRIVAAQFQRLFATDSSARESRYRDAYIPRVAQAIAGAPDDALLNFRVDFERLSADQERRSLSAAALARLSVFGAEAEVDVIGLIGAALRERDEAPDDDDRWRDLYRAGLAGVCRLASKKGAAALQTEIAADPALGQWPHRDLLMNALLAGGMTDAQVTRLLSDPVAAEDAREDLAQRISWARKRADCAY